jgi:hypothetical protein
VQACPPEVPAAGAAEDSPPQAPPEPAAGGSSCGGCSGGVGRRGGRPDGCRCLTALPWRDARLMVMNLTRRLGSYSVVRTQWLHRNSYIGDTRWKYKVDKNIDHYHSIHTTRTSLTGVGTSEHHHQHRCGDGDRRTPRGTHFALVKYDMSVLHISQTHAPRGAASALFSPCSLGRPGPTAIAYRLRALGLATF